MGLFDSDRGKRKKRRWDHKKKPKTDIKPGSRQLTTTADGQASGTQREQGETRRLGHDRGSPLRVGRQSAQTARAERGAEVVENQTGEGDGVVGT
jgi:hypothetical protein